MATASPTQNLKIPKELVFEFLAVFSRFEFSLKESGYYRKGQNDIAEADWARFSVDMNSSFEKIASPDLLDAVKYLIKEPPQRQVIEGKSLKWHPLAFREDQSIAAKTLLSVRMTRNNLFHGGKHFPHSSEGRDEKLIRSSLLVLGYCIEENENVKFDYGTYAF